MRWHYNFKGFVLLLVISVTLLFLAQPGYAQNPKFIWAKQGESKSSEQGKAVAVDKTGNSFITGEFHKAITFGTTTLTSSVDLNVFIAKFNSDGNLLWLKQAGDGNYISVEDIATDASENCIVTGYFKGVVNFDNIKLISNGNYDIFIAKYDRNGNLLWAKNTGRYSTEFCYCVSTDKFDNIVIAGKFYGTTTFDSITLKSSGSYDIFLAKYDPQGNFIWVKQAGGTAFDEAKKLAVDNNNNIVVTGRYNRTAIFDTIKLTSSGGDNFIAKYNPSGNVVWAKKAGGSSYDEINDIAIDRTNNIIAAGGFYYRSTYGSYTLISFGGWDVLIVKYDPSGNVVWAKGAGGAKVDKAHSVASDNSGNIVITGGFEKLSFFDAFSLKSAGNEDIFIANCEESGNILWAEKAGGTGADHCYDVVADGSGGIITTGSFENTAIFGSMNLTSSGMKDVFVVKLKHYLTKPLANFTANPTQGIAPLTVQFNDLSQGNITSWLWDFGDGTTSTQQNPIHIYNPQVDPKFTVSLTVTDPEGSDTETKIDYIAVYLPVYADFDADRTVGPAPLKANFKNLTTGSANSYEWSFGDGFYSDQFEPTHEYSDPGTYHVSLKAEGPGGKDCKYRDAFITVYADSGYLCLKFVKGSDAWYEEPWDNAIDGDTWGWDGTATVEGDTAYGIFEFKNQQIKKIDRFRLMSNSGVYFKNRWVKAFKVQISTTGMSLNDFTTVLDTVKKDGEWETFKINPIDAKYVKLIIDEPGSGWRQVGEFEVWEHIVLPDPMLSTIVATSPHYSTGIDPSTVTLTLLDETGVAITGKVDNIKLYATGSDNNFSQVIETTNPGIYTTTLTTTTPGVKTIWAKVQGMDIRFSNPADSTPCTVEFSEPSLVLSSLELVSHSDAYPGEDWTNAIDGDISGWDGTVTATGWPPYAIFGFTDNGIHPIHKIRMMTNTGVRFSDRWVKKFRILVSTTGTNDSDFKLVLNANQTTGDWQNHYFVMTDAKYVKLIIDEPNTTWRQLGEFQVYEMETMDPIFAEKFVVKSSDSRSSLTPDRFALLQNYPNPFNPETTIRYDLAEAAKVTIVVYNIRGQEVKTLVDGTEHSGRYTISWDAKDNFGIQITAGVYLYRITAEYNSQIFSETRRMILLR